MYFPKYRTEIMDESISITITSTHRRRFLDLEQYIYDYLAGDEDGES